MCPIDPPEVVTNSLGTLFWAYTLPFTDFARAAHRVVMGDDEYAIAWPRTSFAQRDDMEAFLAPIREVMDQELWAKRKLVLAGSSRGASTVLGAVASLMTDKERARAHCVCPPRGRL